MEGEKGNEGVFKSIKSAAKKGVGLLKRKSKASSSELVVPQLGVLKEISEAASNRWEKLEKDSDSGSKNVLEEIEDIVRKGWETTGKNDHAVSIQEVKEDIDSIRSNFVNIARIVIEKGKEIGDSEYRVKSLSTGKPLM